MDLGPLLAQNGPLWDPSDLCIYTSEVDLGPFRAPVGSTWACSGPPRDPLIYAYTRAKWTWAHSGLRTGPVWDPSALCKYTSEMDLGPSRALGVGKSLSQEVGRSSGTGREAARPASKSVGR